MTGPVVRHMRPLWKDLACERVERKKVGHLCRMERERNDLTPGREPEECEESGGAPDCGGNECHLVALVGTSATALVEDGQLVISTLNWIDRSDFSVGTFPSRLNQTC